MNRNRLVQRFFGLKKYLLKRRRIILCLLIIAAFAVFFLPGILLNWIMVYESPVHPADVIFIGVGLGSYLDSAVELHQTGMVKQIVVVHGMEQRIERNGNPVSLHELAVQQLRDKGIPQNAIQSVQWISESKVDGQIRLRSWIRENNIQSYIAFVSKYHTRYAQMVHEDSFPEGDVKLVMISSESSRVWRKQILNIQNTLLRMSYWYWVSAGQIEERIQQIGLGWDREWKKQANLV